MAQEVSKAAFITTSQTNFPDNVTGQISPADLRGQMDDVATSVPFKITNQNSAPTANDDINGTAGTLTASGFVATFAVGDIWIDETSDQAYICSNNTATAAVWLLIGGSLSVQKSGTPLVTQIATWANDTEIRGDANFTYDNSSLRISAIVPGVELNDLDGVVDESRWLTWVDAGVLKINAVDNGGVNGTGFIKMERTGNNVTSLTLTESNLDRAQLTKETLDFTGVNASIGTTSVNNLDIKTNGIARFQISSDGDLVIPGRGPDNLDWVIGDVLQTTGAVRLNMGADRTGDGNALIDLIGDTVYTDYGLRMLRTAGENSTSQIAHRGTGDFLLEALDAGDVVLRSNGRESLRASNLTGDVFIPNQVGLRDTVTTEADVHITRFSTAGSVQIYQTHVDNLNDAEIVFRKARGGAEIPTAIVAGDDLGSIRFEGYDGTDWNLSARIRADTTSATGTFGSELKFIADGNESLRVGGTGISTNSGADYFTYETGTFTPVLADDAVAGNEAIIGGTRANYTKYGEMVYLQFNIRNIDTVTNSLLGNNQIFIRGLPFAPSSNSNDIWLGSVDLTDATFTGAISSRIIGNTEYISVRQTISGSGNAELTVDALTSGTSNIAVNIWYRTA